MVTLLWFSDLKNTLKKAVWIIFKHYNKSWNHQNSGSLHNTGYGNVFLGSYMSIATHIIQWNKNILLVLFQIFALTNTQTRRPSVKIKVQKWALLISRKQLMQHSSPHLLFSVFAQPRWHMFLDLRRPCFNLPHILRCGHSRWLDLLIQLVFFDENPSPSPSLSSLLLPFPVRPHLQHASLLFTVRAGRGNQTHIPGIVCTAHDALTCRWPAQCRCWSVQRGLMSLLTSRTKITQILTHIWVLTKVSLLLGCFSFLGEYSVWLFGGVVSLSVHRHTQTDTPQITER